MWQTGRIIMSHDSAGTTGPAKICDTYARLRHNTL